MTHINGPRWALRPDSPPHAEARRQAVREALQRAREYADAPGTHLAALLEITDLGAENAAPLPPVPAAPGSFRGRAAYGGAEPETPPALDLEPQRRTVYAQVNARFTMAPPKL